MEVFNPSAGFLRERLFLLTSKSRPLEAPGKAAQFSLKGLDFTDILRQRSIEAASYSPVNFVEKRQIDNLIVHRRSLEEYSHFIDLCGKDSEAIFFLIASIQDHLESLTIPGAKAIFSNSWGRSMFCLPGGTKHHAICYEFAKEADGSYSFIIYNKGEGISDSDLHGKVLLHRRGKRVARTRVQIRGLAKEDLKNEEFLRALVEFQHDESATMKEVYSKIKEHLLRGKGGWVREAPEEREWLILKKLSFLSEVESSRLAQLEDRLLQDPDFHGLQTMASCTESNSQTPEHFLLESNLRRKLKLHAIRMTWAMLSNAHHFVPELLAERAAWKMQHLRKRL